MVKIKRNKPKNAQQTHNAFKAETKHIRYIKFNGLIWNELTSFKNKVGANDDAWFQRINNNDNNNAVYKTYAKVDAIMNAMHTIHLWWYFALHMDLVGQFGFLFRFQNDLVIGHL